jgi:hypothetical protein
MHDRKKIPDASGRERGKVIISKHSIASKNNEKKI